MSVLDEILSACASSAQAPKLKLEQSRGIFETRAQIHTILVLPFGAGKTTGIVNLPKTRFSVLTEYTAPGMLGTVSKDGRPVLGEIVKNAGKCIGLDEFQKYTWKAREALLNLLEQQFYARNLGYSSNIPIKKKGKFFKVELKQGDNTIRIESRFSCIATGMFKPNVSVVQRKGSQSESVSAQITEWAFMSRFVPISLRLDLDDMFKVIKGLPIFELKKLHTYNETPVFEDYLKMVNQYESIAKSLPFLKEFEPDKYGLLTRNCLDIARLSAFTDRDSGSVTHWDKWMNIAPFLLFNHISSTLTSNEYSILNAYSFDNMDQKDVAEKLNFSRPYVSKTIGKLGKLGLLIKPELLLLDGNIKEVRVN